MKGCLIDLPLLLPTEKLIESEDYKLLVELLKNFQKIKHDLHEIEKNCVVVVWFIKKVKFRDISWNFIKKGLNGIKENKDNLNHYIGNIPKVLHFNNV